MTSGTVSDPDTSPVPPPPGRGSLLPLALFLTLVLGAAALGGHLYFRNETREVREEAERLLEVFGHRKQAQIAQWRAERLGDGEVLRTRNATSVDVHDALKARPTPESVAAIRSWMGGYITPYKQYDRAYLLGADATVRVVVAPDAAPPSAALVAEAQEAMRTGQVRLVDFYRDETGGDRPFLGLVSPVLDGPGGDAIGAVILRIDPAAFVWAEIGTRIDASETGETELLRRDGPDEVLVLSPLRSAPQAALTLRAPTSDAEQLWATAASGRVGLVTARDHRGVSVLASIDPVPNSPWIVVNHIDSAEVHARLRRHLWLVSTGVALLAFSSGAVLALRRRDQRMRGYQKQAQLSAAVREGEERLRLAMTSAQQGFWDLDVASGRVVTSPEYAAMLGHDADTFQETLEGWNQRVHPADLTHSLRVFDDYAAGRRADYDLELRQRCADGRWIWIHSVGRAVARTADGRPSRMIGIHTDVTPRKTAELAADRQARLYKTLSRCNEAIVRSASPDELLQQVCTAAVEAGGFHLACVAMVDPASGAVRIAASHGAVGYLEGLERALNAASADAEQPMALALREGVALWVDDFQTHPRTAALRERAAAHGVVGGAVVPLQQAGIVVGIFTIYTSVEGGFDVEARTLLTEMAADLSFALEGFARKDQQQKADIRLRQSESRYRSMFAEGGMPMLLIDTTSGQISDANHAAAAFYGWDVQTLRRMNIGDINTMPGERLTEVLRVSGDKARLRHTFQHRLANGELRDVEVFTAAIMLDDQPRVLEIIADVTARNTAARALVEKEHELTDAQRLAHVGSWVLDPGGLNQWSDEMFRLFGLDVVRAVPDLQEFMSLVHPDDQHRVMDQMESDQLGCASTPIDYRIVRRDGSVRQVHARGELRTDGSGRSYLAGTVQDMTELRASEEALRIKDRAIESSLNAVAITDLDGRITYVNGAFADLWAFDNPASVLGRHASSFWESEIEAAAVLRAVSEQGQWSGELRAVTQDGRTLDLLLSAVMVAGDSGAPVCMVGAFVDITARKHAEQTLVASLQEKEALLKEVHHRVKNNLQVISSLLRLELGRASDAGVKSVLGEMQGRIASMALLHETLYRADSLANVDLSTYLSGLVRQIFRSMAPASGRVALRVAMAPSAVDLEQAVPCGLLVNELVSNSLKHAFADNGTGEVRVELDRVDGGPQLRLVVSDTGPGLPADLAERREQTLGLQLVSDLARQLRGTLTVSDGPGTRFTLVFTPRPAALDGGALQ
ncbi:MAG: PAS domain S-box protein [Vicinamibacterales bacterium]